MQKSYKKAMRFIFIFKLTFLLFPFPLVSQESSNEYPGGIPFPLVAEQEIEGWGDFKLGKSYDNIAKLFTTVDFVELAPQNSLYSEIIEPGEERTIHLRKNDFFEIFQLKFTTNEKLYLIQMKLSKNFFSFNQLYERLKNKYGPSQIVRASKVTWTNESRKLILTRDNRLKYIALDEIPLNTNSLSFFINQISENVKENILQGM